MQALLSELQPLYAGEIRRGQLPFTHASLHMPPCQQIPLPARVDEHLLANRAGESISKGPIANAIIIRQTLIDGPVRPWSTMDRPERRPATRGVGLGPTSLRTRGSGGPPAEGDVV